MFKRLRLLLAKWCLKPQDIDTTDLDKVTDMPITQFIAKARELSDQVATLHRLLEQEPDEMLSVLVRNSGLHDAKKFEILQLLTKSPADNSSNYLR